MPDKQKEKATFKLLAKAEEIELDNGVVIVVSHQSISDSKRSSEHLVISKITRDADGTQRDKPKKVFLPYSAKEKVAKAILSLK